MTNSFFENDCTWLCMKKRLIVHICKLDAHSGRVKAFSKLKIILLVDLALPVTTKEEGCMFSGKTSFGLF